MPVSFKKILCSSVTGKTLVGSCSKVCVSIKQETMRPHGLLYKVCDEEAITMIQTETVVR